MKIRVIKKMMAYLLVGAMVLSTPMTASATEPSIADVYTDTDDGGGSGTLSGSSTDTNSGVFNDTLGEEGIEAQVLGLALDKTSLSLEVNGDIASDKLQARVLFNDYDPKDEEMVLTANAATKEVIDKFLRWEVLNNENKVVGLTYCVKPDGSKDYSMVNVNAKNGGKVTVRAYIDYDGDHELDDNEFHAEATVSVKQLAESIEFVKEKMPENFYLKRKYDLNKYIQVNPSTATCDVSFYVGSADAKKVAISDDGIMTVKKLAKKNTAEPIKLYAVTENNKKADVEIMLHPGVPANKVTISSDNGNILDHGKIKTKDMTKATLTAKLDPKTTGVVTDDVEWTVKQPKVPVISMLPQSSEDDERTLQANIKAVGVGTATVTAKASSGEKSTFKITVNSTPSGIEVTDIETWTGAKPSLTAVLYADDCETDKDGNVTKAGTPIQVGKTKVSYRALKGKDDGAATNPKNIKVNAKGVVTSSNLLVDGTKTPIDADSRTIEVTAKFKDGGNQILKTKCKVKVKQANIKNITVTDMTYITSEKPDGKLVDFKGKKQDSASASAVSGGKYTYKAFAFADEKNTTPAPQYNEAIVWASSSAKVGTIAVDKANESGNYGKLSVLKGGTTKVTASYVTVNTNGKGKKTAKLNKKTITVKAVQKATSLTLNKNIFTVVAGSNAKDVAINVKKQLPSGSKDKITWKVVAGDSDGNMLKDKDGNVIKSTNVAPVSAKKTTSVKIPVSQYEAGTVVKVGAYADGGAVAYAYIYVVDDKTKGVQVVKSGAKTTKETMQVGQEPIKLVPQIKNSKNNFVDALTYTKENKGYVSDPVTYSFSKAGIASIDSKGNITAMKPGKTKLTVKTLSGKKATVTITVNP